MSFPTAALYDKYADALQVAAPVFNNYGGKKQFSGPAATVKVFEDNALVRQVLEETGNGKVLIVDGGGSLRCALVGDMLAALAKDNGWAGIIVYGCIRDSTVISGIDIGLKALNTNPRKSAKKNSGERNIEINFADVTINPGNYVYADEDGMLVASFAL